MAAERTVRARFIADTQAYIAGVSRAKAATSEFARELSGAGKTSRADIEKVGRGALVMAAGLAVGLGLAAKAAIDWESSWAGVEKTVDGTASQMNELEGGLRDLAKELPATHGEIAAVAEAAGQLGIKRDAIEGFTRTMVDLGETTNLTADQAATSMARMANIMQTAPADIDRVASTLVALGNAGASTESEILDMSLRIAGAGKQVGLTEDEVLAFANALSSVGVEAEAGGTAISRVFSTIASAVADGGEDLAGFAQVAGMSSEAFASAFRDDAAGATLAFIEGLDGISASGGNVFATLEQLELGDIRVRDALLRASGAGDLFRDSLALASKEWEINNALTTEAEKRYDTTAAKMEIARNNVVDLGIDIGGVLLPAISGAAEGASQMAHGFGEMPGPLEIAGVGLAGVSMAALGMIAGAAILIPKIRDIRTALLTMGAAGKAASAAMPWLAAAAAAIATVSYVMGQNAKEAEEAEARVKGFTGAIREAGDAASGTETEIGRLVSENAGLAEVMDKTGTSVSEMSDALQGSDADFNAFADGLRSSAEAAGVSDEAMHFLVFGLDALRDAAPKGADEAERLARVLDDTGDSTFDLTPKLGGLAGQMGRTAEETEVALKAVKDFQDQLRAGIDPVFAMQDAVRGNADAQQAYAEALWANADAVADNNVSQLELDSLLQAVGSSALDVEVAASDLALAMENGEVSADQFRVQLDRWVAQGAITADQAAVMAWQFGLTADQANRVDGGRTARLFAVDQASPVIDRVNRQLDGIDGRSVSVIIAGQVLGGDKMFMPQRRAGGGPLKPGVPYLFGEEGPEVGVFSSPGQMFSNARSAAIIGRSTLDSLNASRYVSAGSSTSANAGKTIEHMEMNVYPRESARSFMAEGMWQQLAL